MPETFTIDDKIYICYIASPHLKRQYEKLVSKKPNTKIFSISVPYPLERITETLALKEFYEEIKKLKLKNLDYLKDILKKIEQNTNYYDFHVYELNLRSEYICLICRRDLTDKEMTASKKRRASAAARKEKAILAKQEKDRKQLVELIKENPSLALELAKEEVILNS